MIARAFQVLGSLLDDEDRELVGRVVVIFATGVGGVVSVAFVAGLAVRAFEAAR